MLSILSTRRFALWTRLFKQWLTRKFDSISIDLTPVEDKLDAIDGKIGTPAEGQPTTLFGAIAAGGSGGGEDAHNLAEFFGLPEALPEYTYATDQDVIDINDDVMGALYGYGKVAVTIHSLMRTGAETTQDLASVIYVDPEKTWAENGYPTLYDDEGEPIDTTTNPAAGDEVFNYQIQSES